MNDDPLNKKFELVSVPNSEPIMTREIITSESQAVTDFKQARKAMSDVLVEGSKAVKELSDLAISAQQPEPYGSLASLIGQMSTASSTLMKLHAQLEQITSREVKEKEETHNHLHLPVSMSTQQLAETLKMISSKKDS